MEQFEEILLTDYCYESFIEYGEDLLFNLMKDKNYKKLVDKRKKILNDNKKVQDVVEGNKFHSLTESESKNLYNYLVILNDIREYERKEIFVRGMKEAYYLFKKMDILK